MLCSSIGAWNISSSTCSTSTIFSAWACPWETLRQRSTSASVPHFVEPSQNNYFCSSSYSHCYLPLVSAPILWQYVERLISPRSTYSRSLQISLAVSHPDYFLDFVLILMNSSLKACLGMAALTASYKAKLTSRIVQGDSPGLHA